MENIIKYYHYLVSLINKEQYQQRRSIVLKHIERSLHDGYLLLDSKPKSKFMPIDYANDISMYYLVQLELYIGHYVEHDAAFITRLYPKVNIIGSMLDELIQTVNFAQKNIKMLRKNNKTIENDLFEICTACVYLKNGYKEIEFIKEIENEKTPDLKVGDIFIECKRKVKECDYSLEERNYWYKQYDPVSKFMLSQKLALVFEVNFKMELSNYSNDYLLKNIKDMIEVYKCNNYQSKDIDIKLRPVNIVQYNKERQETNIRMDKPLFNKILFRYDMKKGGLTTLLGLEYDKKMYKVSPNIDFACAGIWYSSSEESFTKKSVSLRNNLEKAINQLPDHQKSNIHICYESYEGQEIEKRIIEKALNDLNSLNMENKRIHNVFLHILRPEVDDHEDSVFEETVVPFQGSFPCLLEDKFIFGK